ncbi:MAG: DNA alkylation repair protein [Lachnospiraceae bacterium]|nr:DNA alkylation repair protein [Lachnospiraceae bacterium]
MISDEIREELFEMKDESYRDFQGALIPNIENKEMIGVRTPVLRSYAKKLVKRDDIEEFLGDLPHKYFDENQLQAFIISEIKDYDTCIIETERFLPYIDNWATCDQMSPKVFKKHKKELLRRIKKWIKSDRTYTIRFGVGMLMAHYLDDDFEPAYLKLTAKIKSDEYYVNMMRAWYFATALAKQYDATIHYLEEKKLDAWTHDKTIQKAVESLRISKDQKEYLKTLKIKSRSLSNKKQA